MRAREAGADIRLGRGSHRIRGRWQARTGAASPMAARRHIDLVIGADGTVLRNARDACARKRPQPAFTGQAVWRYNFPRPPGLDACRPTKGPDRARPGAASADELMYMYVTTPEPGNPRYPREGLAAAMRGKLTQAPPAHRDAGASRSPTTTAWSTARWNGCSSTAPGTRAAWCCWAMPCTPPRRTSARAPAWPSRTASCWPKNWRAHDTPEAAFAAYRARRFERCRYIVEPVGGHLPRPARPAARRSTRCRRATACSRCIARPL